MKNSLTLPSVMKLTPNTVVRVFISIFIIGVLFKIMHWPYAGIILVSALAGIIISSVVKFIGLEQKTYYHISKLTLVIVFCLSAIFSFQHWPYSGILKILFWISLLVFLAFEVQRLKTQSTSSDSSALLPSSWLWMSAAALTTVGFLFKIMHWPYANILMVIGMTLGSVWFLRDLFISGGDE